MRSTSEHDYWVQVIAEADGELLAQEPLVELGHLVDEARFQAASCLRLPDEPPHLSARLEPVAGSDETYPDRLRISLWHQQRPGQEFTLEVATQEIAEPRGMELIAQLAEEGRLNSEDRCRTRLAAAPRAAPPSRSGLAGLESVELEERPFPVQPGRLADWGILPQALEAIDPRRPLFVARPIVEQALARAIEAGNRETGTLLLGNLVEDRSLLAAGAASAWALVVTEQVEVPEGTGTTASYIYPPEAFRRARSLADLRGRGEEVVGSQHSHGWRCRECTLRCEIRNLFFSAHDEVMARQFPVYAAFLVVGGDPARNRDRPVADLFVRLQGAMRPVPFATFDPEEQTTRGATQSDAREERP